MKKFFLLLTVLGAVLTSFAQPPGIKVSNETDCVMYAYLFEVDGACNITTHNVMIPPNSTIGVNATAGGAFEFALVTDTFAPYDYSCYYVKVQVPWATCISGYASTMVGSTCCASSPVKSTWEHPISTVSQPYLFIYD